MYYLGVVQDPTNGRFCEGTTARLSCIIFDNSTGRAANTTIWLNNTAIDSISDDRVKNIVDGDNVTSVLTLMDVSKDLNNSNYSCRPSRTIISSGAVITVIGKKHTCTHKGIFRGSKTFFINSTIKLHFISI